MKRIRDAAFLSFAALYLLTPAIGAAFIMISIAYVLAKAAVLLASIVSAAITWLT